MFDLTRILSAETLRQALYAKEVTSYKVHEEGIDVWYPPDWDSKFSHQQIKSCVLIFNSVGNWISNSPCLITPSLDLCRLLDYSDINIVLEDYRQPFEYVGVHLKKEIIGTEQDLLAVSHWDGNSISLSVQSRIGTDNQYFPFAIRGKYINDILAETPLTVIQKNGEVVRGNLTEDHFLFNRIAKLVFNLCLLACHKDYTLSDLDDKALKRQRRAPYDKRMAELSVRDARIIDIREIDLIVKRSRIKEAYEQGETDKWRQPIHMRRGYRRIQPVGIGRKERREVWVAPYWVGLGEGGEKKEPPKNLVTIMS